MPSRKPEIGDTVLYTAKMVGQNQVASLVTYPGLVTSIEDGGDVNLVVFFDHHVPAGGMNGSNTGHPTSVPYSLFEAMHTWRHRDDRAPQPKADPLEEKPAGKPVSKENKKPK